MRTFSRASGHVSGFESMAGKRTTKGTRVGILTGCTDLRSKDVLGGLAGASVVGGGLK